MHSTPTQGLLPLYTKMCKVFWFGSAIFWCLCLNWRCLAVHVINGAHFNVRVSAMTSSSCFCLLCMYAWGGVGMNLVLRTQGSVGSSHYHTMLLYMTTIQNSLNVNLQVLLCTFCLFWFTESPHLKEILNYIKLCFKTRQDRTFLCLADCMTW